MKHIFFTLLIIVCVISGQTQAIHENDIVINEIMADPNPAIVLPEWEYIELFNTSDFTINIRDWILTINKKEYYFRNDIEIKAKEFLILCHDDALNDLSTYGECYTFSSFQITNSGTSISLSSDEGKMISSVEFDISWHSSDYKEEGGWSLEQIDAYNPCAGKHNWGSSISKTGGSPGTENSIKDDNIITPKLDYINPVSSNTLEIHFNQNMNVETLQNIDNYIIAETQTHPNEIIVAPNNNSSARLCFDSDFEEGRLYTININNVSNCKDIPIEYEINSIFGLPSTAEASDIIINEILFDPISPCSDYLELYNRSDKVIDLSSLLVGTIKESFPNPPDTIVKEICSESRILVPDSYILLSSDGESIIYHYDSEAENFLDVKSFPAFSSEEGHVIVCDKSRHIIDQMRYSEKMHYELLAVTKGVALERISAEQSSTDSKNWHSASFNVNYGTPGYRNSVATDPDKEIHSDIDIVPEVFSPDGDGYDDICSIIYNLQDIGHSMNIRIFDSKGVLVRNLVNNNLVNGSGVVFWDGCDNNGRRVAAGIYIVQTELFDLEGSVKRMKKCVVVATK